MHFFRKKPAITRTIKTLLKALYYAFGVLLAIFVVFHIWIAVRTTFVVNKERSSFENGISKDLARLKTQGDLVAKNPLLIEKLKTNSISELQVIILQELKNRSIGLMGVANAEGIIVSRTLSVGRRGDNVFLTAPAGRVVSQNKSIETVELTTGFYSELFLTTGRPIIDDGKMIGAVFANNLTNDAYVERFKKEYLLPGTEVVFYNKINGIDGISFKNEKERALIKSYFNSGSDWIQHGLSGKVIQFENGDLYMLENYVFPGVEESPGGAILFIPVNDISSFTHAVTSIIVLFVFLFFAVYKHKNKKGQVQGKLYYILLVVAAVPATIMVYFASHAYDIGRLQLRQVPYILYNSTIEIQPSSGVYEVGVDQHFPIMINTGDEPINAVKITLNFDPKKVEIISLDTKNSVCDYFIENVVDQENGKARLSCIILDSGNSRNLLSIADVVATPKVVGDFTFAFDKEETHVYANDGLGTDVLRMSQDSTYQAQLFGNSTSTSSALTVFSPTHDNQSRWYNNRKAKFVWNGDVEGVYNYVIDNKPTTIPTKDSKTVKGISIDVDITGDGIYYFHLKSVNDEHAVHYKIQSDRTPPSIVEMRFSEKLVYVGDVVRFEFDAEDFGSGVQHNYYVNLGAHLFLPVGNNLFLPLIQAGDQKVILRVFDDAGNYAEKTEIIRVNEK